MSSVPPVFLFFPMRPLYPAENKAFLKGFSLKAAGTESQSFVQPSNDRKKMRVNLVKGWRLFQPGPLLQSFLMQM